MADETRNSKPETVEELRLDGEKEEERLGDEGESSKVKEMRRKNEQPVDRGWAWVVCFAGFMFYFIAVLGTRTLALLFLEITDIYDSSITVVSLSLLVRILSFSFFTTLSTTVLVPRFGEKWTVCGGGLLYALGSIGQACAPNIAVFILVSVCKGAHGCTLVTGMGVIRHYFHKRRSMAMSIATLGSSAASIATAPLIGAFNHEFGVRGTFLLVAALELHIVAAGLLLRPADSYRYKPDLPPLEKKGKKSIKKRGMKQKSQKEGAEESEENPTTQHSNGTLPTNGKDQEKDPLESEQVGSPKTGTNRTSPNDMVPLSGSSNQNHKTELEEEYIQLVNQDSKLSAPGNDPDPRQIEAMRSTLSLATSVDGFEMVEEVASRDAKAEGEDGKKKENKGSSCFACLRSRCSRSILGLWGIRLTLISCCTSALVLYMQAYVPTIARTQGATLDQSAILLTVMGSVDVLGRSAVGLLADTQLLNPSTILAGSFVCLGVLCQFLRFFTTFPTLVLMAIILGFFVGQRSSLTPSIALEVAGTDRMPEAYSLYLTSGMLFFAAANPIFGAIAEITGNFINVLHITGVFLFIAAVCLLCVPLVVRIDRRHGRSKE